MLKTRLATTAALVLFGIVGVGCSDNHDSGSAQKTKGHFQEAAGSLIGSSKLEHEGKKNEVSGGVKSVVGDFKQTVHDATK